MPSMIHRARGGVQILRSRLAGIRRRAEEQAESIAHTGETLMSSGLAGIVDGYLYQPDVGGIPVVLAAGVVTRLGAFALSERAAPHFAAIGDGLISSFIYRKAYELGESAAAKANDISLAQLQTNRANGLNDDGTPADLEDLLGHPGQQAPA